MITPPVQRNDKTPIQDHCGVVGIFSTTDALLFEVGYQALLTMQTRGYDGAGFWAVDSAGTEYEHKGTGMIASVLAAKIHSLRHTPITILLLQTRYGTSGNQSTQNIQPLRRRHVSGEVFGLAHNGQFTQKKPSSLSDTVLFARQLRTNTGNNWFARLAQSLSKQDGAYSLLLGTQTGLYACRDPRGIRPLVYGPLNNSNTQWIIASETVALLAAGATRFHEVLPGELVTINSSKPKKTYFATKATPSALCIFENVYLLNEHTKAHAPSTTATALRRNRTVNQARFRSGQILATEAPLSAAAVDYVIGIPGTGIAGGQGYANKLKLPYVQAIIDRATPESEKRTFMSANIGDIGTEALSHFTIDPTMIRGKKICIVDDSLVRGNITKSIIHLLKKQYGAKTVHVRILCPPIDKPCHLGINTRNAKELIVHQCGGDLTAVCAHIGADSLEYLSAKGLAQAITEKADTQGFCLGCMQGYVAPV